MKRWMWALPLLAALSLGAALRAQEDERGRRDSAVRETLDTFWSATMRGDATAFRRSVDLPLTMLEPSAGDQTGMGRFILTEELWPAFKANFPAAPLSPEQVQVRISALRLEWMGEHTCLAVYDFAARTPTQESGGHFMTVITWADGWKVVVTTVPV